MMMKYRNRQQIDVYSRYHRSHHYYKNHKQCYHFQKINNRLYKHHDDRSSTNRKWIPIHHKKNDQKWKTHHPNQEPIHHENIQYVNRNDRTGTHQHKNEKSTHKDKHDQPNQSIKFVFHNVEPKLIPRLITGAYLHLKNTYSAIQLIKYHLNHLHQISSLKQSKQVKHAQHNHHDHLYLQYTLNIDLYLLAIDWFKIFLWILGCIHWIGRITILPVFMTFLYVNHRIVLPRPMSMVEYNMKTGQMKTNSFYHLEKAKLNRLL